MRGGKQLVEWDVREVRVGEVAIPIAGREREEPRENAGVVFAEPSEPPSASRAARISSRTNPWEFGGAVSTSSPSKRPAIGSASAVSCSARSSRVSLDPSDRSRLTRLAPTSPPYNTDGPSAAIARSVRARAGWRRDAPSGSGAPSARKTARIPVSAASSRCSSSIAEASERETGTPSSAYTMAPSSASARLRRPPSESSVCQAATAPGTVTGAGPVSGICACASRRCSPRPQRPRRRCH